MFSKSRWYMMAATFSLILTLCLGSAPGQRKGADKTPTDFALRAVSGPRVTAESLRGEVVVLAFGANWLPLSRQQLEGVKKFADDYSSRGVAVYWVSTDSESAKSRNYASDEQLRALADKYKVSILRDPEGQVSKDFGVDQLPAIVILDKQGNVHSVVGGLDPTANLSDQIRNDLKDLL